MNEITRGMSILLPTIFCILFMAIGITILVSPLLRILADWTIRLNPNIMGIGLMLIGCIGLYVLSRMDKK